MTELTAERLRELLDYDPETGDFTWKVNRRCVRSGSVAGNVNCVDGYCYIGVDARRYHAHRLAWLYIKGAWPNDQIDHINGNKADNRFANLRQATHSQNQANGGRYSNNASGYNGVTLH